VTIYGNVTTKADIRKAEGRNKARAEDIKKEKWEGCPDDPKGENTPESNSVAEKTRATPSLLPRTKRENIKDGGNNA